MLKTDSPGLLPWLGHDPEEQQVEQKTDETGAAEGYTDDKENRSVSYLYHFHTYTFRLVQYIILSHAREAGSPVKPVAAAPTRHGP